MSLSRDARGPYLAGGFERVEEVRRELLAAGWQAHLDGAQELGCAAQPANTW